MSRRRLQARKARKKDERRKCRLLRERRRLNRQRPSEATEQLDRLIASGCDDIVRRLKRRTKPDWETVVDECDESFEACLSALRSSDLPKRLAECDRSLAEVHTGYVAKPPEAWESGIAGWIRMIEKLRVEVRAERATGWSDAVNTFFRSWDLVGTIHEILHSFEDGGAKTVFDLTEDAHDAVHDLLVSLEDGVFYKYAWGV